ncbi:MAG: 2Fe-2S iron-sulfur cluster-binding protein [Candidatus Hodarchaeales archaeon]|jgi:coenzyme F420 hydrogenase subunit beta
MPRIKIDGIQFDAPHGWTILDVAKFLGLDIPTLCFHEGLSSWGGCRLCLVEISENNRMKLVSSCTFPVIEGLEIKTATQEVIKTRKMVLELLISQCPTSKVLQDMASKMGLNQIRIHPKWENCIHCGLCVRICKEQMMAKALQFVNRGNNLKISTPFDVTSDECRRCGACMYICPVVTLRCEGPNTTNVLCNGCFNDLQPTCLNNFDHYECWMGLKGECGTCIQELEINAKNKLEV